MVARIFFRRTKILAEKFRFRGFSTLEAACVKCRGCNCSERGARSQVFVVRSSLLDWPGCNLTFSTCASALECHMLLVQAVNGSASTLATDFRGAGCIGWALAKRSRSMSGRFGLRNAGKLFTTSSASFMRLWYCASPQGWPESANRWRVSRISFK